MPRPSFLADINISPLTVALLQGKGWDVIRASELLPATADDRDLLNAARRQGRAVITHDLDFSTLLAVEGLSQPSLITLRLAATDPVAVAARLDEVALMLSELLQQPCAVTIEDLNVRARRLPIA